MCLAYTHGAPEQGSVRERLKLSPMVIYNSALWIRRLDPAREKTHLRKRYKSEICFSFFDGCAVVYPHYSQIQRAIIIMIQTT